MALIIDTSAYPEALALVGAAQSIWEGSNVSVTINISVSHALNDSLRGYLDNDIESIFITDSDIRHIRKTHSDGEKDRGQVDVKPEDFAALPLILNEFDSLIPSGKDKLGNARLLFAKDVNGMVYVATVQRGQKETRNKISLEK